ncbi:MAG TPA: protein phosphatase 2C domain-containing protein [Thermoanaerobaculia bacterium]|nr:protein phosphatase 2C domain-containing protein [Thermoanaerobaculia bacterium]
MSPSRRIAAAGTDPGRERENNEDRVLCEPERGIFAVVDGVGGESGGEVASQIATDVLRARLSRRTTDLDRLVREAIALANRQIFERAQADPRLAGMSCVLTVALLDGDQATIGHVGDSRLYLLRPGEIRKITRDHSPVGTREDAGEISEDEAMHHPRRNEIFRDVGSAPHEPDDQGFVEIHQIPFDADSALLICSDGLSDLVPSARIRQAVEAHAGDPQAAIDQLIDEANEAGGKDNISIVIVEGERYAERVRGAAALEDTRAGKVVPKPAPKQYGAAHTRERSVLPWILLLLILAAAAGAWFYPPVRERLLKLNDRQEDPAPTPPPTPILHVGPGEADFLSISDALAAAKPGQTIEVAPGQYQEAVELKDGVALVSRTPRGAVIQAPDAAPAVSGRGVRTRFVGFKIEAEAVGLLLDGAQVEVSEVEVTGAAEAGIAVSGADRSSIEASFVHDNTGAGIVVDGGAATRLRQNLIARNGTKAPKRPGIEIRGQARPLLIENRIEGNGAAGVWLPTAERTDEILQWNQFGRASRSQAVKVAPAQTPPPQSPTPAPGRNPLGRNR